MEKIYISTELWSIFNSNFKPRSNNNINTKKKRERESANLRSQLRKASHKPIEWSEKEICQWSLFPQKTKKKKKSERERKREKKNCDSPNPIDLLRNIWFPSLAFGSVFTVFVRKKKLIYFRFSFVYDSIYTIVTIPNEIQYCCCTQEKIILLRWAMIGFQKQRRSVIWIFFFFKLLATNLGRRIRMFPKIDMLMNNHGGPNMVE